jgi:hypothetical protein
MFGNLLKAAVGVVKLPVDVVADVVTMGGALNDKPQPYTAEGLSDIIRNLEKAVDPDGK